MVIKKRPVVKREVKQFAGDVLPSNDEMSARAEMMMMGFVIAMTPTSEEFSRREVIWYTTYILSVIRGNTPVDNTKEANDVFDAIQRYSKNTVMHMVTNRLHGMVVITYTLDTPREDEPYPDDLSTPDGVFSYVYNVTCPEFSELGYTFYEKQHGRYHRIG